MHAVIFELKAVPGGEEEFLEIAQKISGGLEKQEGFISQDLLTSLVDDKKRLSLSFWESEEAITGWRTQMAHRQGQGKGKEELFSEYRVRVAEVVRDYGKTNRREAPIDSVKAFK